MLKGSQTVCLLIMASMLGCQTVRPTAPPGANATGLAAAPDKPAAAPLPRELDMVSHPTYVVESPDILLIDAISLIPLPPYRIAPLDSIVIQVGNVPAEEPIAGLYRVEVDGTVDLGFSYGTVAVAGLTIPEARRAIEDHLKQVKLKNPQVRVATGQVAGLQQIRGEHLVRPDGTVSLGKYGNVYVAGLTLDEVKAAIELQLSKYLRNPEVIVDVGAYNSKNYYVVTDGGGYGEQVYRFPSTGKETVLDAISQVNGLPVVASKKRIWVARPTPEDHECYEVLPVDWKAITRGGATTTNYQILPGDRIFVQANPLITVDTALARIFAPIERVLGITLLGSAVYRSIAAPLNRGVTGNGVGF